MRALARGDSCSIGGHIPAASSTLAVLSIRSAPHLTPVSRGQKKMRSRTSRPLAVVLRLGASPLELLGCRKTP
jgi:hypothetical protein